MRHAALIAFQARAYLFGTDLAELKERTDILEFDSLNSGASGVVELVADVHLDLLKLLCFRVSSLVFLLAVDADGVAVVFVKLKCLHDTQTRQLVFGQGVGVPAAVGRPIDGETHV